MGDATGAVAGAAVAGPTEATSGTVSEDAVPADAGCTRLVGATVATDGVN
jgi:hypothetical protein